MDYKVNENRKMGRKLRPAFKASREQMTAKRTVNRAGISSKDQHLGPATEFVVVDKHLGAAREPLNSDFSCPAFTLKFLARIPSFAR